MSVDWKKIASHRDDWRKLSAAFEKAGLPPARWVNCEPVWDKKVDMKAVEKVANEYGSKRHRSKA